MINLHVVYGKDNRSRVMMREQNLVFRGDFKDMQYQLRISNAFIARRIYSLPIFGFFMTSPFL